MVAIQSHRLVSNMSAHSEHLNPCCLVGKSTFVYVARLALVLALDRWVQTNPVGFTCKTVAAR